jgi:hypothetical protein
MEDTVLAPLRVRGIDPFAPSVTAALARDEQM